MAKKSAIENNQRKITWRRNSPARRQRLLDVANNEKLPMEERFEARLKLAGCRATARRFGSATAAR